MNAVITPYNDKWLIVFTNGSKVCDCFEVESLCFQSKYAELFKEDEDEDLECSLETV